MNDVTYEGRIVEGEWQARVRRRGVGSPLPPRLDLVNHSPGGFAWGYSGSGPAQLSLAILADHLGAIDRNKPVRYCDSCERAPTPDEQRTLERRPFASTWVCAACLADEEARERAPTARAMRLHQRFKNVLANIEQHKPWLLTGEQVADVVTRLESGKLPIGYATEIAEVAMRAAESIWRRFHAAGFTDVWYAHPGLKSYEEYQQGDLAKRFGPRWHAGVWTGEEQDLICVYHCDTNIQAQAALSPGGWSPEEAVELALTKLAELGPKGVGR